MYTKGNINYKLNEIKHIGDSITISLVDFEIIENMVKFIFMNKTLTGDCNFLLGNGASL